ATPPWRKSCGPTTSPVNKTLPSSTSSSPSRSESSSSSAGGSVVGETRSARGRAPASAAPPMCQRARPGSGSEGGRGAYPSCAARTPASGHRAATIAARAGAGGLAAACRSRDAARALSGEASSSVRVAPARSKTSNARRGSAPSASNNSATAASPCGDRPSNACSCRTGRPAARSGKVGGIRHSAHARTQPSSARRRIAFFYLRMPAPMRWPLLEPVRTRLADEQGALRKQAEVRIALCYPSPYHVGMSSLGFQTIYREINDHPAAAAERAFLPDEEDAAEVCTYETQSDLSAFRALAFSVSYELEITGFFRMLQLAGIPLLRAEREPGRHPLIIAGGPLTFSNPVPLAPFADVIVLGEAEDLIPALVDALASSDPRA